MDDGPIKCPECGELFPGQTMLTWHRQAVHGQREKDTEKAEEDLKQSDIFKSIFTGIDAGKGLGRTTVILSVILAIIGVPASLFSCIENFQTSNLQVLYIGISSILRFAFIITAYKLPIFGGILFIVDGSILAWALSSSLPSGFLIMVLPLLLVVCGILYIITWAKNLKPL
jgi:hypothetical protein